MKKDILNLVVPQNCDGYRIDKFLREQIINFSRTRLQKLINGGEIKLNNNIIKNSSKKIREQDQIKINCQSQLNYFNFTAFFHNKNSNYNSYQ